MPRRVPYARPPLAPARVASVEEGKAFYSTARWRRLRAAFLRAHPLCSDCEAGGRVTASEIAHHKREVAHSPGQALDWGNLEALCKSCHNRRHKADKGIG